MKATREVAFEDAIVESLLSEGGYTRGVHSHYDPALALDTAELFTFAGATQNDEWEELIRRYGGDPNLAQRRFAERLAKQIDERGTIDVLRHGVDLEPLWRGRDHDLRGLRPARVTVRRRSVLASRAARHP